MTAVFLMMWEMRSVVGEAGNTQELWRRDERMLAPGSPESAFLTRMVTQSFLKIFNV